MSLCIVPRPFATLLLSLVIALLANSGRGGPLTVTVQPAGTPGSDVFLKVSEPRESNDTGIRFLNKSSESGQVTIEFRSETVPKIGETVAAGFVLLDGTLDVHTTLEGEKRVRCRMEYDVRGVRRLGLRRISLRLFRLDESSARWVRARRAIRNVRRADVRRLADQRADFILGHYGFSSAESYVWAVLDVNSIYAIGGLPVPEPASGILLGSGGALLLWRLVRGRRRPRAG
ncbi:MAG: PEP-CTERM sorting domain-containing protein [Rhodospirillales bacterium]|jgi:hypothetical protein|nr:PEP-CTERM sorting domain-containing protein [Rhodospirillales bacterium]